MKKMRITLLLCLLGLPWAYAEQQCQYHYDANDRLIGISGDINETYVYDRRGNLSEIRREGETVEFEYDAGNQLVSRRDKEGVHTFVYDSAGRMVEERLHGKTAVRYTYGFLDKVTAVERNGEVTKFRYNGEGMLIEKEYPDGRLEKWSWDGMALIGRGEERYINEPHASGGVPILSLTKKGVRYHTSDYLGTTLWSRDREGRITDNYLDATPFGEGDSLKGDPAARFTGKPYDKDLGAFVFPYRNYDAENARWRSADPSGFPDGINNHVYAYNPLTQIDPLGSDIWHYLDSSGAGGFGHSGWIVGNPDDGYRVYDYGNAFEGGSSGSGEGTDLIGSFSTFDAAESSLLQNRRDNGGAFDRVQKTTSTPEEDAAFKEGADKYYNQPYDFTKHNCYGLGVFGVGYANGIDYPPSIFISNAIVPNIAFDNNMANNEWTVWYPLEM